MPHNIGFIGGGNMSTAIFKGITAKDCHCSSIWVSGPNLDHLEHWRASGANVTTENAEVFSHCDFVFLGIKQAMLNSVVDSLSGVEIKGPKLVISMLAGVDLTKLLKAFQNFRTIQIARIMPNLPMAIGSGACMYSYSGGVQKDQRQILEKLLKACGECEEIPESLMDSLGVLTACGPAYMFMVIEALADGAVKQGVPRGTALRFAAQMMKGSAHLVLDSKKHPGQLKDEVCSPGGTTIAGVSVLEEHGVRSAFIKAIEASTVRTKEILSKTSQ